jgi:hypothetical protein
MLYDACPQVHTVQPAFTKDVHHGILHVACRQYHHEHFV